MIEVSVEQAGIQGLSAYEVARQNGFEGTEQEWLASLRYDHSEEFEGFVEDIHTTVDEFNTNAQSTLEAYNTNATNKLNEYNNNDVDKTTAYNTNANNKTTAYNTNHTNSLKEYDDNADEKLNAYNDNSSAKLNAFDTNASDKTTAFNSNVTEKTNTFNSNASTKTSAYDSNATSKLNTYNSNDSSKTTAYNNNATSKLNAYNTNATTKLNEYNTNADTRLQEFNDNASTFDERLNVVEETSQENKENIADNTNRVKRITNDLYDSGEASGTFINVKDTTLAELAELGLEVVDCQVTTQGYNLVNILDTIVGASGSGLTTEKNDDGTLSIKGTTNRSWDYTISEPINFEAGKTYSLSIPKCIKTGSSNAITFYLRFSTANGGQKSFNSDYSETGKPVVFTINEDETQALKFSMGADVNLDFIGGIQVQEGSITEMPTFEKFTGNQPSPSPSYPQEIKVIEKGFELVSCNKNLFDLNKYPFVERVAYNGAEQVYWDGYCGILEYFPVEQNTEYAFSNDLGKPIYFGLVFYDKNKIVLSKIATNTNAFTTPENCKYIRFAINSTELPTWVQLEKGDKATEFEPYQESILPINLPQGEFFGPYDQITTEFNEEDGLSYAYLEKNGGKLSSYEEINFIQPYTGKTYKIFCFELKKKAKSSNGSEKIGLMSNKYKEKSRDRVWDHSESGFAYGDKNYYYKDLVFWSEEVQGMTVDEFRLWLQEQFKGENPLVVHYRLAEPYRVNLGVVDMPLSYSPETNITTTHELQPNINIKYYRNFINTIQNLQVNEKALKEELVDINSRLTALETNLVNMASVESESEE